MKIISTLAAFIQPSTHPSIHSNANWNAAAQTRNWRHPNSAMGIPRCKRFNPDVMKTSALCRSTPTVPHDGRNFRMGKYCRRSCSALHSLLRIIAPRRRGRWRLDRAPLQLYAALYYLCANANLSRSFSYFNWASTDPKGKCCCCWDPCEGNVALLPGPSPEAPPLLPPPLLLLLPEPGEFLSIFCWWAWPCFGLSDGCCDDGKGILKK